VDARKQTRVAQVVEILPNGLHADREPTGQGVDRDAPFGPRDVHDRVLTLREHTGRPPRDENETLFGASAPASWESESAFWTGDHA
jgi:hypothetical protein